MTSTYNPRAVRVVRRAQSKRLSAWTWVPPIAWLLLADAAALVALALFCLMTMDAKSREFLSQVRGLDAIVALAGLCFGGALVVAVRAAWRRSASGG